MNKTLVVEALNRLLEDLEKEYDSVPYNRATLQVSGVSPSFFQELIRDYDIMNCEVVSEDSFREVIDECIEMSIVGEKNTTVYQMPSDNHDGVWLTESEAHITSEFINKYTIKRDPDSLALEEKIKAIKLEIISLTTEYQ